MDSRSSFSPLEKLVPLSERISLTCPLLAMNLISANTKESVSRLCETSISTARMAKHVKINNPASLHETSSTLHLKRTKVVDTDRCKGRLSTGRSAIFCSKTGR